MTNPLKSSISSLIELDTKEAALREELHQLTRRKEEAKKTEGEKAKEELYEKIPAARVDLLGHLRTADNLGIEIDGEYTMTLHRIVKNAGATGIALALVQEVLPDIKKLQEARDDLGPKGTNEIIELKAKEHLKEGKGRGLYFVWNAKASAGTAGSTETQQSESGAGDDAGETTEEQPEAQAKPAKKSTTR